MKNLKLWVTFLPITGIQGSLPREDCAYCRYESISRSLQYYTGPEITAFYTAMNKVQLSVAWLFGEVVEYLSLLTFNVAHLLQSTVVTKTLMSE